MYLDILTFFDNCEMHGRGIPVVIDPLGIGHSSGDASSSAVGSGGRRDSVTANNGDRPGHHHGPLDPAKNSVAYEARRLKSLYLQLYE